MAEFAGKLIVARTGRVGFYYNVYSLRGAESPRQNAGHSGYTVLAIRGEVSFSQVVCAWAWYFVFRDLSSGRNGFEVTHTTVSVF